MIYPTHMCQINKQSGHNPLRWTVQPLPIRQSEKQLERRRTFFSSPSHASARDCVTTETPFTITSRCYSHGLYSHVSPQHLVFTCSLKSNHWLTLGSSDYWLILAELPLTLNHSTCFIYSESHVKTKELRPKYTQFLVLPSYKTAIKFSTRGAGEERKRVKRGAP